MRFDEMLISAKAGNKQAVTFILDMYQPLLIKESIVDGSYDEDLYQELCITLLKCINQFRI